MNAVLWQVFLCTNTLYFSSRLLNLSALIKRLLQLTIAHVYIFVVIEASFYHFQDVEVREERAVHQIRKIVSQSRCQWPSFVSCESIHESN